MNDDTPRIIAYVWEVLFERAITEPDPDVRRLRLLETQQAILARARALDDQPGDHEPEAEALEEAAELIREMKLQTQADGIGKEVKPGDKRNLPNSH
jgi:hypothetical protein